MFDIRVPGYAPEDVSADNMAEEILVALHFRASQKRIAGTGHAHRLNALGQGLAEQFEDAYNWDPGIWDRIKSKRVTVTVKAVK